MTLTKRIIPCLDIDKGRVVKGINFTNLTDAGDPIEVAKRYDQEGADELVILDISASHESRHITYRTIEQIASEVFIPLTVGGGIREIEDINKLLRSGADKVSINTSAVQNPNLIEDAANRFGSQCIVAAIDAKKIIDTPIQWEVVTFGGRKKTGIDVINWIKKVEELGAGEILLTSMDRDGTKQGFDNLLNLEATQNSSIPVIASGGAGSPKDLIDGILKGGVEAVLAASIFHYSEFSIKAVKNKLLSAGIPVRIL
tara:strand:- start:4794 stop:5564 length:771 start_codon:yes stop_codon:yes gene_type:complete